MRLIKNIALILGMMLSLLACKRMHSAPADDFTDEWKFFWQHQFEFSSGRVVTFIHDSMPKAMWLELTQSVYYHLGENTPVNTRLHLMQLADSVLSFPPVSGFCRMVRGELMLERTDFVAAERLLRESMELNRNCGRRTDEMDATRFLARYYRLIGAPDVALRLLNAVYAHYETTRLKDLNPRFNVRMDLASCYNQVGDFRKALFWSKEAKKIVGTDQNKLAQSVGAISLASDKIAENFLALGEPDSSIAVCRQSRELQKKYGEVYLNLYAGNNPMARELQKQNEEGFDYSMTSLQLGKAFLIKKEQAKALHYVLEADSVNKQVGNLVRLGSIKECLGDVYTAQGRSSEAATAYQQALVRNDYEFKARVWQKLAQLSGSVGDFQHAYRALHNSVTLQQSENGSEKNKLLRYIDYQAEIQQKEEDLERLSRERADLKSRLTQFLVLLVVLTLLFALFIVSQQKKEEMRGKEAALLRMHQVLVEKQLEEQQAQLSRSEKLLAYRNKLISHLELQIKNFSDEAVHAGGRGNLRILNEADWADFKSKFELAEPGLMFRLRSDFPRMTIGEQRLFSLIRLGFSGKDKATVLGISLESIWRSRNRLRSKLGLGAGDNLEEFVLGY
jgi:tetratricopeptide (TPR) repeat protein